MYVDLVISALSGCFFGSCAEPFAANAVIPTAAKPSNNLMLHLQNTQA